MTCACGRQAFVFITHSCVASFYMEKTVALATAKVDDSCQLSWKPVVVFNNERTNELITQKRLYSAKQADCREHRTERHKINIIPLIFLLFIIVWQLAMKQKIKKNCNNNTHLKLPKDTHVQRMSEN